jgi:mitogen-activated protein kinase 15
VIFSDNNTDLYLVFEYLESDLFKAIKNRVLNATHKKFIVYQLACALKYLHSAGVLHRDLKPSNILLNTNCQIKLCDFGLSRTLKSSSFINPVLTEFIATRWYRSPEVILGSKSYSTKSDMWSLGCLIYELYSRRTLLPGDNTIDQITKMI